MFNPYNWYWKAEDERIYGSLKQALVDYTNADFTAWLNEGYQPTPWPKNINGVETDEALSEVLNAHGLSLYAPTPDEIKLSLKSQIDQQAETERLKYITPGVGQGMTYTEKVDQAVNYSKSLAAYLKYPDNNKAPNENEYLLLKSSLGVDGDTLAEVAETITFSYLQWQTIGAAIETIRLQSKVLIDASETIEEAQAIFDAVKWPN